MPWYEPRAIGSVDSQARTLPLCYITFSCYLYIMCSLSYSSPVPPLVYFWKTCLVITCCGCCCLPNLVEDVVFCCSSLQMLRVGGWLWVASQPRPARTGWGWGGWGDGRWLHQDEADIRLLVKQWSLVSLYKCDQIGRFTAIWALFGRSIVY